MALFHGPRQQGQHVNRQPHQQPQVNPQHQQPPRQPLQQTTPLPPPFTRLQLDCRKHFGPVPLKHIGFGATHNGAPVAIYACPLCNQRQAWGQDFQTGQPRHLFTVPGK